MINFALNTAVLTVKNALEETVLKQEITQGSQNNLITYVKPALNFPLVHIISVESNGKTMSVNGKKELSVIPTLRKVEIPVFVGTEGESYLIFLFFISQEKGEM